MKLTVIILVTMLVFVGCALPNKQSMTKTDWRRAILVQLDEEAIGKELGKAGYLICINSPKETKINDYYHFFRDCIYEIADEMPDVVNNEEWVVSLREIDTCADIKYAKKYLSKWNISDVPKSKHQKCLNVLDTLQKLSKLE